MSAYNDPGQSSSAPSSSSPSSSGNVSDRTFSDRIKKADATTLGQLMRVGNGLNAVLLGAVGVTAFMLLSLSVQIVLMALYVISFSFLLFVFECLSRRYLSSFREYFGFMFKWQGRLIFFFFTATLCFGLGTFGIVAGSVTIANVFFNIFVLVKNPIYHDNLANDAEMAKQSSSAGPAGASAAPGAGPNSSAGREANPFTVDVTVGAAGHNVTVPVSMSQIAAGASMAASAASAQTTSSGKPLPSGWEKIYDEGTKRYYYYNSKTQESRWDLE